MKSFIFSILIFLLSLLLVSCNVSWHAQYDFLNKVPRNDAVISNNGEINKINNEVNVIALVDLDKSQFDSINKINSLEPAAVFITGDLFDGMKSDFSWLTPDFIKFKTSKGVFYSYGNHDLYLGFNRINDLLKDHNINILDNKLKVVDGLQIIGINYSFNHDFNLHQEILNQSGYNEAKASLLLFHEPKNIDLAVKAGIDLQLSGHTHRGHLFPLGLIVNLFYKGYGYGLFQVGSFSLVVNNGLGTWGPPMRTSGNSEIVKVILKPL